MIELRDSVDGPGRPPELLDSGMRHRLNITSSSSNTDVSVVCGEGYCEAVVSSNDT